MRDLTDVTVAVSLNGKRSRPPGAQGASPEPAAERTPYHQKLIEFIDSLPWNNGAGAVDESGLFDVLSKSIDAMQTTIANFKLAGYPPDVLIELPKDICSIYEFHRADEMIAIGRRAAEAALDDLERFL